LVLLITLYESCTYVSRNMAFLCFCVCVTKIIRCHLVCICTRACLDQKCAEGTNSSSSDLVQNFHPCLGRQKSTTWLSLLNAQLMSIVYKPCAMCLSLLHFQPSAGVRSDPDCNCCLSNKYTYMQLRSPEVTRVNFHLTKATLLLGMEHTVLELAAVFCSIWALQC